MLNVRGPIDMYVSTRTSSGWLDWTKSSANLVTSLGRETSRKWRWTFCMDSERRVNAIYTDIQNNMEMDILHGQ